MLDIFENELSKAEDIAVIDYHTGLGPAATASGSASTSRNSDSLARVKDWYNDDFTSPYLGTSSSVELSGFNVMGMESALKEGVRLSAIALEYGTQPTQQVKLALRADNWLHIHGDQARRRAEASSARSATPSTRTRTTGRR